ncbi:hypothetical protein ACFQGT_08730 [Natrialbaceae archaeon GCM10025810]|uniref:DUF7350 domain-containing protein n=1 Tax=Halovalidus salilacus TaxID=3075124 RepID=UPI003615D243
MTDPSTGAARTPATGDARRQPSRRTVLRRVAATASATTLAALAGCAVDDDGGNGDDSAGGDGDGGGDGDDEADRSADAVPDLPRVEDPPDAVYVPTHREAMRTLEPIDAGEYRLAPMLSYPHRFWLVDGENRELVEPDRPGVHLMITLWDAETGVVLPVGSNVSIRLRKDGEAVGSPRTPWSMLSQQMGVHFGDNVPLEEDGTYGVEVTVPPPSIETTGALEGRMTESDTVTFEFTYDEAFRDEVVGGVEYLDEEYWGRPGALEPMDHARHSADHDGGDDHERIPYSTLSPAAELPGTPVRESTDGSGDPDESGGDDGDGTEDAESERDLEPTSGDATFVVRLLEPGSRLADEGDGYLLISPRTPYNRVPLPEMALSATVEREGETVTRPDVTQRIDDEYGLHYGASVEDVRPGDAVTIEIDSPPQVSRHAGYETAFVDMPALELTVPDDATTDSDA